MPLPWAARPRALIGMLHLPPLPGEPGSPGLAAVVEGALRDLAALEAGGASAALVENWKDQSPGPFADPGVAVALAVVVREVARAGALPVGVNVLPNDYRTAFALVGAGARFVWLDVFVDRVRTDYAYSRVAPFEVAVDLADLAAWRARLGGDAAVLASVHPKHYALLDPTDTLEQSARRAREAGADAVVVTGSATGSAPEPERVARVRAALGAHPVLVGSGLTAANAAALLAQADGAIVGTSIKTPDFERVDPARLAPVRAAFDALEGAS
ncbi:MAG: BtpA/SgcQ family protein [Planctomycetota bacterium]